MGSKSGLWHYFQQKQHRAWLNCWSSILIWAKLYLQYEICVECEKNSIQSPWYFFVTWDRPSMNKSNTEDHHIPCWSSLKVRTEHVPILHNAVDMSTPQEMKLLNHQFSLCFTLKFPESHQYSTSKKVCFHVWSFRQTFIMAPNENTRRRADFPTDSSESLDLRHVKIWSKATPPYQPYKVVPPQW